MTAAALTNPQTAEESCAKAPDDNQDQLRTLWEKEMGQKSTPVKHDKTSVLMLSFDTEDDDLKVKGEVDTLAETLETGYRFRVTKRFLNTKKPPQQQAFKHLSDFVYEEDDERALLVVYYAGHGWSEADSTGKIRLSGKFPSSQIEAANHSIDWIEVERVLAKTRADVFVIFDCCHAGLLCRPAHRDGPVMRSFQYLGACGAEQRTRAPGAMSFTTAITWAFRKLLVDKKQGFSINELAALVKIAPNFPEDQYPQLYDGRFELSLEYLFIAPTLHFGAKALETQGRYRDEVVQQRKAYELLDLRFFFPNPVSEEELKSIARELRSRCHHKSQVPWIKVSLIRKFSVAQWAGMKWKNVARERARTRSQPVTPVTSTPIAPARSETLGVSRARSDGSLQPPRLVIQDSNNSDDDTVTHSPLSERTPLLPDSMANGKAPKAHDMSRSQSDDDVLYHLKRAGTTFFAKTTSGLAWSLKAMFSCYPGKRKGDRPA